VNVIAVMPAFEEAPRVKDAVVACRNFVNRVIVVDDGSRDETSLRAKEAGAIVLRHRVNRGQGAALRTGTRAALKLGADVVVHIDADGQHDPCFIPATIAPIVAGTHDVVFGSRFLGVKVEGMPWSRRFLAFGIRQFNTYALGIPYQVTDTQTGFRALSKSAAQGITFRQDEMAHCSEILRIVTRGWRWKEVPVRIRYTDDALAKGQKASNALRIVWQLFIGSLHR